MTELRIGVSEAEKGPVLGLRIRQKSAASRR